MIKKSDSVPIAYTSGIGLHSTLTVPLSKLILASEQILTQPDKLYTTFVLQTGTRMFSCRSFRSFRSIRLTEIAERLNGNEMNAPNDANGRPLLAAGRLAGSPSLHAAKFKMSPAAAAARHQTSPDLTGRRAEVNVFRESGQFPPPRHLPRYTYNSQKCKRRTNPVKQEIMALSNHFTLFRK